MNAVNFIHSMVAPSVMISACGLLLLGMNNKYSLVVNRIRLLNAELRNQPTEDRKKCISKQMPLLIKRLKLIKNAVWFYTLAVVFFVLTVLLLGFNFILKQNLFSIIILTFFIGVIFLILGAIFAANETRLGYKIVKEIEVGNFQIK